MKTLGSSTTTLNEFHMKTFKTVASMKKWSTRKSYVFIAALHRYITCLIPVSEWRDTSKKKHVKNRVKFKQTCPRSSTTSRSAFTFTMKAEIMILSFSNLLQNDRNIICVSSSPRSKKAKKILWERFVQKEYHLCNTDEWMRKLQTKIRHRSSTWNNRKFNYYTE